MINHDKVRIMFAGKSLLNWHRSIVALLILPLLFGQSVLAQNIMFNGLVLDERKLPVQSASVILQGTNTGAYSDSLGFFSLQIPAGATLIISAIGYQSDTVNIGSGNRITILLRKSETTLAKVVVPAPSAQKREYVADPSGTITGQSIGNALDDFSRAQSSTSMGMTRSNNIYTGSALPEFTHREDTRGSRYFFDKWLEGVLVDSANNIIANKNYLFNYDKITGLLLLTEDMKTMLQLNKGIVKSFDLKDGAGKETVFELIPEINNGNFLDRLVNGAKYRLYKSIKTKFEKANYRTDGVVESGHSYDAYLDDFAYYLVDVKTMAVRKFDLKKKSVKEAFGMESEKTQKYFTLHNDSGVNEDFIKGLTDYLNQ
jgi:hypothetical protein